MVPVKKTDDLLAALVLSSFANSVIFLLNFEISIDYINVNVGVRTLTVPMFFPRPHRRRARAVKPNVNNFV